MQANAFPTLPQVLLVCIGLRDLHRSLALEKLIFFLTSNDFAFCVSCLKLDRLVQFGEGAQALGMAETGVRFQYSFALPFGRNWEELVSRKM